MDVRTRRPSITARQQSIPCGTVTVLAPGESGPAPLPDCPEGQVRDARGRCVPAEDAPDGGGNGGVGGDLPGGMSGRQLAILAALAAVAVTVVR